MTRPRPRQPKISLLIHYEEVESQQDQYLSDVFTFIELFTLSLAMQDQDQLQGVC